MRLPRWLRRKPAVSWRAPRRPLSMESLNELMREHYVEPLRQFFKDPAGWLFPIRWRAEDHLEHEHGLDGRCVFPELGPWTFIDSEGHEWVQVDTVEVDNIDEPIIVRRVAA